MQRLTDQLVNRTKIVNTPTYLSWWYICFRNGRCMELQDLWVSATSTCAMTTTGGLEEERVTIKGFYDMFSR